MEIITGLIGFILHIDQHLAALMQQYGQWIYAILFVIVFCETGLVVTPFLPGDSLLFVAGALAALGGMNVWLLIVLLILAAIAGDSANYSIGRAFGAKLLAPPHRWLKREYIERTESFYARHGGKTIVLARFVPIVRTFAPFVAGVGTMSYRRFIAYNIAGGVAWVTLLVLGGYFFGNIPAVKKNLSLVLLVIIVLSVFPLFIEFLRQRRAKRSA